MTFSAASCSRQDSRASGVAEDQHKAGAKLLDREFDGIQVERRDLVSGAAKHEQVSEPLVEQNLRRNPGIGARDYYRKWPLIQTDLFAALWRSVPIHHESVRESLVARQQPF